MAAGTTDLLYRSNSMAFAEQDRVMMAIANRQRARAGGHQAIDRGQRRSARSSRRRRASGFVHISHDTPALDDVTVGSGLAGPAGVQSVGWRRSTGYVRIDRAARRRLYDRPCRRRRGLVLMCSSKSSTPITAGAYYTAYAMGPASVVDAVVVAADARSVPTQAAFRFLHGAGGLEDSELLDLYLRLPGEAVDFDDDDTVPEHFGPWPIRTPSSQFALEQGDYDIYFCAGRDL